MTGQEPRMTDEPRAPKSAAAPVRADTRQARARTERDADEREQTMDREMTEDERFEAFVESQEQSIMPKLPKIDGYHLCWLTTQNKHDTIARRLAMGYTLIRVEEIPGVSGESLKVGDRDGILAVNEMVAAKIPLSLYNRMMAYSHHTRPLEEEGKLKTRTELLKQQAQADGRGLSVQAGDGYDTLVQGARPMPVMSE